ncbi:mCG15313, isoform CRA_b [Mus musculus]|nr:mCG15313, isoform CRA_b [Mus musculus]
MELAEDWLVESLRL